MLLMEKPAKAARLCGLTRLTDTLHGRWIREMVFGQGDMTLLAHRGSYKTTCLSFAMAVMLVVYPRKNLLFLRKTDSDVLEVLRQVKLLLATDTMQELTGRIYGSPVQVLRGDMWSVNTDCYAAIRGAPQLLGLGTGGSMTGKHADIILTDDIVNLQDRISVVERKRICGVYQELQNIRNLQAFQSTFDSVYHDFFRKLEEAYPELNNKDKLLCAYIKMNLLSKEIAPLLNISLRGVEISRYRLRKKLGLEEGENLAEFLQRFNK